MLLCDIGNTSFHFLDGDKEYKNEVSTFDPASLKEKVCYICVNPNLTAVLKELDNWIDLSTSINKNNYYDTMGIDRIIACEAIENGIIVDAGSAVTVDIVKDSVFEGGFIYPGIKAMKDTYENISSALKYEFNFALDLDKLPKNSQDAISYGYLKTLQQEVLSHKIQIYLTGGDAGEFISIFPSATLDNRLVFNGMKKYIKE